jgi:hypothetical protein
VLFFCFVSFLFLFFFDFSFFSLLLFFSLLSFYSACFFFLILLSVAFCSLFSSSISLLLFFISFAGPVRQRENEQAWASRRRQHDWALWVRAALIRNPSWARCGLEEELDGVVWAAGGGCASETGTADGREHGSGAALASFFSFLICLHQLMFLFSLLLTDCSGGVDCRWAVKY